MPIPQFHRTPKTRKRRTRRAPPAQERFDVNDIALENAAEALSVQAIELDENCALLQRGSANDEVASPPDEVPALLSGWPPRSK